MSELSQRAVKAPESPRVAKQEAKGQKGQSEAGLVRSALELISGADQPGQARGDKPEIPGALSFMRRNWGSGGKADEGFFRRYRRLRKEYRKAVERAAGNLRTYETIAGAASFNKEFSALLFASCVIATTGLFQGSTAVIIGAMLIAPLMMPILGFALGAIWGDERLLWRSLGTLLVGSLLVLAISASLAALVPGIELNSEIRGRINPNLYDILIAIASGLIGAYAYSNPRISPSIAGVSIAVALMPPLCTVGIGLGLGSSKIAVGALLLYLSNLLGISLAASFVFWRLGIHPMTQTTDEVSVRARRNVVLTGLLLVAVGLPLAYFMKQTYATKKLDASVRAALLGSIEHSELLSLSVQGFGGGYDLRSVVIVPAETSRGELVAARETVEALLPAGSGIRLYFLRTGRDELMVRAPVPAEAAAEAEARAEAPAEADDSEPAPQVAQRPRPKARQRPRRTDATRRRCADVPPRLRAVRGC